MGTSQGHKEVRKYRYTRVSTNYQNPDLQLTALKRAGYKTIFKDEDTWGDDKALGVG